MTSKKILSVLFLILFSQFVVFAAPPKRPSSQPRQKAGQSRSKSAQGKGSSKAASKRRNQNKQLSNDSSNSIDYEAPNKEVDVTILETSGLHGYIFPFNYSDNTDADFGLAKVATLIKDERKADPNLILLDGGDSLSGNYLDNCIDEDVYPMIKVMNKLKYDACQMGEFDFNFDYKTMKNFIATNKADILLANAYRGKERCFTPYVIKNVKGVRVAIVGLLSTNLLVEKRIEPSNYNYITFEKIENEMDKVLNELSGKTDVIVLMLHMGSQLDENDEAIINFIEKYDDRISVFFVGHKSEEFKLAPRINVVALNPMSKGRSLAKVVMKFTKDDYGLWRLNGLNGNILPVAGMNLEADEEIINDLQSVKTRLESVSDSDLAVVKKDFVTDKLWNGINGLPLSLVEDTPLLDFINTIQLLNSRANVSMACLYNLDVNIKQGGFKKQYSLDICPYKYKLYSIKITGRELKDIMEKYAGSVYNQSRFGDITVSFAPNIEVSDFYAFSGLSYIIDVSQEVGNRIQNIMYKNATLRDNQVLTLALNENIYNRLVEEGYISSSKDIIAYTSHDYIRGLVNDYVMEEKVLFPRCDYNWDIVGYNKNDPHASSFFELARRAEFQLKNNSNSLLNTVSINANFLRSQGVLEKYKSVLENKT